ncbi:MAG: hypothetical protein ACUVT0_09860 [Thermochromatium sp.]
MSQDRFDILFDGTLQPGADPHLVRKRLMSAFKLDAAGIERLFVGKTVAVKRGVDLSTAARYQRVFEAAGAMVTLRALATEDGPASHPPQPSVVDESAAAAVSAPHAQRPEPPPADHTGFDSATATASLSAEGGFEFLERPPSDKMPDLDLSHLSLVSHPDWSLADCDRPPAPTHIPDISHLRLEPIEPTPNDDSTAQTPIP